MCIRDRFNSISVIHCSADHETEIINPLCLHRKIPNGECTSGCRFRHFNNTKQQFEEDIKRNCCTPTQPDCGTFESKSRIVKSLYLLYFRPRWTKALHVEIRYICTHVTESEIINLMYFRRPISDVGMAHARVALNWLVPVQREQTRTCTRTVEKTVTWLDSISMIHCCADHEKEIINQPYFHRPILGGECTSGSGLCHVNKTKQAVQGGH